MKYVGWKDVKGYEGIYQINASGQFMYYSLKKKKWKDKKTFKFHDNECVKLSKDKVKSNHSVKKLVEENFTQEEIDLHKATLERFGLSMD